MSDTTNRAGVRRFRVELADTDATGGIHHTAALRWAEQTEQQLLSALGLVDAIAFPRRRIDVEFERALRYGDEFDVRIEIEAVGRTSVTYRWVGRLGDIVYFHGRSVAVHVRDGRPAPVPDALARAAAPSASPSTGSDAEQGVT
ncbi:MAG TPA: 4-hydroxybenzoyl-CoA thioesterase [Microbacterium sp.]|nr:4-hydroxybenzoyl-CoA thioesterase [Microbacterium sp.]HBR90185.1 4-hydroxybenzoyl-CoA thioesterase [Microbacterium sp.]|tara:strand:+ start:3297 stop:3728 length:432 start_codon:yes stop_codon:yes gene_type:complete